MRLGAEDGSASGVNASDALTTFEQIFKKRISERGMREGGWS